MNTVNRAVDNGSRLGFVFLRWCRLDYSFVSSSDQLVLLQASLRQITEKASCYLRVNDVRWLMLGDREECILSQEAFVPIILTIHITYMYLQRLNIS